MGNSVVTRVKKAGTDEASGPFVVLGLAGIPTDESEIPYLISTNEII